MNRRGWTSPPAPICKSKIYYLLSSAMSWRKISSVSVRSFSKIIFVRSVIISHIRSAVISLILYVRSLVSFRLKLFFVVILLFNKFLMFFIYFLFKLSFLSRFIRMFNNLVLRRTLSMMRCRKTFRIKPQFLSTLLLQLIVIKLSCS